MRPAISIIIPTLNEAANLPELLRRIDVAMSAAGYEYEAILVDDGSTDDTEAVVDELALKFPMRLIQRGRGAEGGLSGAVLAGFAQARGEVLAVMDADLQHPPEKLPELLEPLKAGEEATKRRSDEATKGPGAQVVGGAEMVVGSRYVSGGSVAEKWGGFRKLNSQVATLLARPFAGSLRDPMSGFFALPRRVFERGRHLSPLGYKILLELMCKCTPQPVVEVPIHFGERYAGRSKLTLKEQFHYLEHLSRLYDYKFPRASPMVKFAIVVACAWLAGAAVFALLLGPMGNVGATAFAYATAIAVAALFHLRYVRTQKRFLVRPTPWSDFLVSALLELATAVAIAVYLNLRVPGAAPWELFVVPLAAATIIRYVMRKELLLDVRGLRPEERMVRALDALARRDASTNETATDRAAEASRQSRGD